MAKATSKATSLTTLVIGQVQVPVALFSTVAAPSKLADFDTAGPGGGVLMAREIARPVPVAALTEDAPDQPVISDPFADDPKSTPAPGDPGPVGPGAEFGSVEVEGRYGRELVEQGTGEVVAPEQVRRGVRLEDGRFIDCTAQLAEIERDTKLEAMTVVGFVDVTQVPRLRVKGGLYLGAGSEAAPAALRVLFEGLKATRRGAIVKVTKRSRQTLGVIAATRETLVLFELVWREDVREAPARAKAMMKAPVSDAAVEQFVKLIDAMSVPVAELDALRDDAIARREELKLAALAGEVPQVLAPAGQPDAPLDIIGQIEATLASVAR